jgi:hypothetical protein
VGTSSDRRVTKVGLRRLQGNICRHGVMQKRFKRSDFRLGSEGESAVSGRGFGISQKTAQLRLEIPHDSIAVDVSYLGRPAGPSTRHLAYVLAEPPDIFFIAKS